MKKEQLEGGGGENKLPKEIQDKIRVEADSYAVNEYPTLTDAESDFAFHMQEACQDEAAKNFKDGAYFGYSLSTSKIAEPEKRIDELKEEKEGQCESDHVSIDDLLCEFNRRGFNTDNWDGDAEAPEAIVSGVKNHINELLEQKDSRIADLEKELGDTRLGITYWSGKYGDAVLLANRFDEQLKIEEAKTKQLREGLEGMVNEYELTVRNKLKGLGTPFNDDMLPTYSKAKQLLKENT